LPGERELAAKYGTNRNTLREAVRRLEQSRLVTVRHGQGVTVADFRKTGTMELLSPYLETGPDVLEIVHLLEDILPARLMVLEFASRLAVQRANASDIERLRDITDLLIAAFERGDPKVVGHGFQRWLDALIDAGHSVSIRWIANPFLEAYRDIIDRYPALWVLEPSFPQSLRDFITALADGDEERTIDVTRKYYRRVDDAFIRALTDAFGAPPGSRRRPSPIASDDAAEPASRGNGKADSPRKKPRRTEPT
jgi:GntR family transcriptional repressor for pyruvate dehydrogenase complex